MPKKKQGNTFVPVTPGGTPLIELKAATRAQAINNLLREAAHMPYRDWEGFARRGYKIECWINWRG